MAVDHKLLDIADRASEQHHNGHYLQAMRLRNEAYEITFEKMRKLDEQIRDESANMPQWENERSEKENAYQTDFWNERIKGLIFERGQLYGSLLTFEELFYESARKLLAECDGPGGQNGE